MEWLIKRKLRRESLQDWLKMAQEKGKNELPREGKTIWRRHTHREVAGFAEPLRIVFDIPERTTKKGQCLLVPDAEVERSGRNC